MLLRRGGGLQVSVPLSRIGGLLLLLLLQVLDRKVGRVDVGREVGLKGGADEAEGLEVHAREEGVILDLVRACAAQTVLRVAHQAPDQVLGAVADPDVVGEGKVVLPADDLPVDVPPALGAEGRPADEALEHDGAQGPLPLHAVSTSHARREWSRGLEGGG